MRTITAILAFALVSAEPAELGEVDYSKIIAEKAHGVTEFRLPDQSRVDIMLSEFGVTYATEVEWASKWQQAIGQSLYYAIQTNSKPGIILLWKSQDDQKFYLRCSVVCAKYGIYLRVYDTTSGKLIP